MTKITHTKDDTKILILETRDQKLQFICEDNTDPATSATHPKRYIFEGPCADFNEKNDNGRLYDKDDYLKHVDYLQEDIELNQLAGEVDHADEDFDPKMRSISHLVRKLWYDENTNQVMIRIEIIPNRFGQDIMAAADMGMPIYISSRASGFINKKGEVTLERIYTYDIVYRPGFRNAKLERMNESLNFKSKSVAIYEWKDGQGMEINKNNTNEMNFITETEFNGFSKEIKQKLISFEKIINEVKSTLSGDDDSLPQGINNFSAKKKNNKAVMLFEEKIASLHKELSNIDKNGDFKIVKENLESLDKKINTDKLLAQSLFEHFKSQKGKIQHLVVENAKMTTYLKDMGMKMNEMIDGFDSLKEKMEINEMYINKQTNTINELRKGLKIKGGKVNEDDQQTIVTRKQLFDILTEIGDIKDIGGVCDAMIGSDEDDECPTSIFGDDLITTIGKEKAELVLSKLTESKVNEGASFTGDISKDGAAIKKLYLEFFKNEHAPDDCVAAVAEASGYTVEQIANELTQQKVYLKENYELLDGNNEPLKEGDKVQYNGKKAIITMISDEKIEFEFEDGSVDEINSNNSNNLIKIDESKVNEDSAIKTIEDKDNERKFVFYKTRTGKLEFDVLELEDGEYTKNGPTMDDIEWLKAEENPQIDAFLKSQGLFESKNKKIFEGLNELQSQTCVNIFGDCDTIESEDFVLDINKKIQDKEITAGSYKKIEDDGSIYLIGEQGESFILTPQEFESLTRVEEKKKDYTSLIKNLLTKVNEKKQNKEIEALTKQFPFFEELNNVTRRNFLQLHETNKKRVSEGISNGGITKVNVDEIVVNLLKENSDVVNLLSGVDADTMKIWESLSDEQRGQVVSLYRLKGIKPNNYNSQLFWESLDFSRHKENLVRRGTSVNESANDQFDVDLGYSPKIVDKMLG